MHPRRHTLSFDIGAFESVNKLQFCTHEQVRGIEVGYDIEPSDIYEDQPPPSDWLEKFIRQYCPRTTVHWYVMECVKWITKLDIKLRHFYLQFQMERRLGDSGFMGRAVLGKNRRGLLILEFCVVRSQMAMEVDDDCENIIPHELMHLKDGLEGRSPTVFPFVDWDEYWIDLIRHLSIDGHLEQLGFPHIRKEARVRQLRDGLASTGKQITDKQLRETVEAWWGQNMTLRQAIDIGFRLGFTLKEISPFRRWYRL